VHYVCDAPGGRGAFREFAEWLLCLRGQPSSEASHAKRDPDR
jgi:3-deoxy-D-manno-octulosonate 8-phosphate phosphatase KdsC-like HAD superfamily phosphatase